VCAAGGLEEGTRLTLDFGKLAAVVAGGRGVVPVVVQDADSKQVLFVAYANQTALAYALEHGVAVFWSTSRSELWVKGATSGDTLQLVEVRINCEQNSHQGRRRHIASQLLLPPDRGRKTGICGVGDGKDTQAGHTQGEPTGIDGQAL
jgi:phosphoribosyl-AMP cyclohydrolase